MQTSLIGMGLLLAASPVVAQDPLAPLPEAPAQIPVSPPVAPVQPPQLPPADQPVPVQSQIVPRAQPAVQQPSVAWAPVVRPVAIPRTWRDVFAAIRAGDWAGAQTGIATLPSNVLTPVT